MPAQNANAPQKQHLRERGITQEKKEKKIQSWHTLLYKFLEAVNTMMTNPIKACVQYLEDKFYSHKFH